ncbi:MAG: hypothetical protein GY820_31955 [Gammaproteobacteria bacterium]|nr:hypothetical protein [Gammaproteobacteria bacterium]
MTESCPILNGMCVVVLSAAYLWHVDNGVGSRGGVGVGDYVPGSAVPMEPMRRQHTYNPPTYNNGLASHRPGSSMADAHDQETNEPIDPVRQDKTTTDAHAPPL